MTSKILFCYDRTVLGRPVMTLFVIAILIAVIASYLNQFRLDASSDTLMLENDQSLAYYRAIKAIYGSNDNLIITYTPNQPLFSDSVIHDLRKLHDQLTAIKSVDTVTSLLNVPLIESPPISLSDLANENQIITLEHPRTQRSLAEQEFLNSPLYSNLLISPDGKTTAFTVQFKRDETFYRLLKARNDLRMLRLEGELSEKESDDLSRAEQKFSAYSASLQKQVGNDIDRVRNILDQYRDKATLHLGGVPMITADSINFVRNDLVTFGVVVFALLVLILTIIFNRPRWVLMAMSTCVVAGLSMMGILGLIQWPVTVVSSNFVSLLLILTLSLLVHLIVRYRELVKLDPQANQRELLLATVKSKFIPCLYTALTSMVAFGSLVVSDIRPIIDFGWMMVFGLTISMVLAFTIFPASLALFSRETKARQNTITLSIPRFFVYCNKHFGNWILKGFVILTVISAFGILQLTVENRFIDYYKSSTEIYQGMEMIDRELGGTTPMDIIIDAPSDFLNRMNSNNNHEISEEDSELAELDDLFSDEDEQDEGEAGITGTSYWFNSFTLQHIAEIHDYLDSLDETGKVLSLTTTMRLLQKLDPEILDNNFALALLYKQLPEDMKSLLIAPYLSADGNQLRFSIRVFESDPSLRRQELLEKIRYHLTTELELDNDQVKVTGMLVLYNNMLQSLFQSQIVTIGVVFVAILLMFLVLFRNPFMAIIAIIPNIFSAALVLGLMGWLRIPLDIMTITIAAICIGIAVDNTIHYVHRYGEEIKRDGNYWGAVRRSHDTIGCAIYYTTLTIALGFSILAFSNFIPTIYFGLLTGFSMIAALVANLTLLPLLIVRFKPFRT
ncbi:MAG: transporter [Gammaproteobacteria bacterium]|nr:MAG: transporter [Gammaproteobacteria bacterium]